MHTHSRRTLLRVIASAAAIVFVGAAFLAWHSLRSRASNASSIHSIAVLPFANASKDPEMDYFGKGLSEEITNSLSRLPNLQVMARSTVSHYKSRDDPQGVGRGLHVDAVMTGRVGEHGSELDVETELVDVATGAQLWGKRYTRGTNDASLLQSAITRDITTQLRPRLSGDERESLAKVGTKDAEAYRFYLEGRHQFDEWTQETLKASAEFFDKAIARDAKYAAAYAHEVACWIKVGTGKTQEGLAECRRALELDPLSVLHNVILAWEYDFARDYKHAIEAANRRWRLTPGIPMRFQFSDSRTSKWGTINRRWMSG